MPGGTRRRGQELEEALLEAAWAELVETGYGALTIEAVAQRAGTSRTVIYRRWATKAELVTAAVQRVLWREPVSIPDTGSLRGDMIELIRQVNRTRVGSSALVAFYLGGYFQETGTSPGDLRDARPTASTSPVDVIIDRAVERGEVDASRLTPRRRTVAVDLLRNEALMRLQPVPDDVIVEIIDDIFLPLVVSRTDR